MFDSKLKGSVCAEIKTFRYFTAGRTMAEFELLCFEDGQIGTQGFITETKEDFALTKVFTVEDEAVQAVIHKVEEKIKDFDWVKSTEKYSTVSEIK